MAGYQAMGLTVMIWAGFALTARNAQSAGLAVADVAFIRVVVPSILLLPFLPSRLARIRAVGWKLGGTIAFCAGAPFMMLATAGGLATSAAHVAALIAGPVPLIVGLILFTTQGTVPGRLARLGLLMIGAGVIAMVVALGSLDVAGLGGIALLLSACAIWSVFTISVRRSGLDPLSTALLVAVPSTLAMIVLMLIGVVPTEIGTFSLEAALPFLIVQGLGVGIAANLGYAYAVSTIGPETSSAIGSSAPAVAAVLAVPLLGEALDTVTITGVALICVGVLLASRPARPT